MWRRMNLDGSPVATRFYASGFRMAAQLVTSPAAMTGLMVGLGLAAAEIFSARRLATDEAVYCVVAHLTGPVGASIFNKMNFAYRDKVSPKMAAVIETTAAGKDADAGMRAAAVKKFREIAGLQAGCAVAIAAVVASRGGAQAVPEATVVWSLFLQAAWNKYAAHRIGENAWHVAVRPTGAALCKESVAQLTQKS